MLGLTLLLLGKPSQYLATIERVQTTELGACFMIYLFFTTVTVSSSTLIALLFNQGFVYFIFHSQILVP